MSIDGFIAKKNGSVDWLDKYNNTNEDYGYTKFYKSLNTIILGNTTYKQFPQEYKNKNCYIFSKQKQTQKNNIIFINDKPENLIKSLDPKTNKKIWLVGGANLVNQFIKSNLIDELIISIIPDFLGSGIRLFENNNQELSIKIKETKTYKTGIVQIKYKILK